MTDTAPDGLTCHNCGRELAYKVTHIPRYGSAAALLGSALVLLSVAATSWIKISNGNLEQYGIPLVAALVTGLLLRRRKDALRCIHCGDMYVDPYQ
jgi:hypothetical protein